MIQVNGRWVVPVTTPDGLPTGEYRWTTDNELANVQAVHHFLNPIEVIMNWIYHFNALTEQDI